MAKLITVGQILDTTWDHYTKHFKIIMRISLWFFLIALLMIVGKFLTPVNPAELLIANPQVSITSNIGYLIIILTSLVVSPILAVWIFLSLIKLIDTQNTGKNTDPTTAGLEGGKQFFHYLIILVFKLVALSLPLVLMIPGIALSIYGVTEKGGPWVGSVSMLLLFFGAIAGLILLAYITVQLAFIAFALMLDGKKHINAIKDSTELVKGRFWSVLWRLFVPKLIFGVAAMMIQGIIFFAVVPILSFSTLNIEASLRIADITYYLVASGMSVIFVPLLVIADYKIYDSLRKNPIKPEKNS